MISRILIVMHFILVIDKIAWHDLINHNIYIIPLGNIHEIVQDP
jgi:hypothetical protein